MSDYWSVPVKVTMLLVWLLLLVTLGANILSVKVQNSFNKCNLIISLAIFRMQVWIYITGIVLNSRNYKNRFVFIVVCTNTG